jgi:beta-lactamase class A
MCSTFKASLAACVLSRVDRGQDRLEEPISYGRDDLQSYAPVARDHLGEGALSVQAMCQAAVELSDNTCANLLLARVGGPAALTAFWRGLGDKRSRLDHNEPLLNRSPAGDPHDTTTPAAMAATLESIVLGSVLSDVSKHRLTAWLVNCRTGGDRLRAGLPKSWTIGDKTGNNGADAAGDIAVVFSPSSGPLIISAYVQGGAPTRADLDHLFAALGSWIRARLF